MQKAYIGSSSHKSRDCSQQYPPPVVIRLDSRPAQRVQGQRGEGDQGSRKTNHHHRNNVCSLFKSKVVADRLESVVDRLHSQNLTISQRCLSLISRCSGLYPFSLALLAHDQLGPQLLWLVRFRLLSIWLRVPLFRFWAGGGCGDYFALC